MAASAAVRFGFGGVRQSEVGAQDVYAGLA
jgi:hypothetical protein